MKLTPTMYRISALACTRTIGSDGRISTYTYLSEHPVAVRTFNESEDYVIRCIRASQHDIDNAARKGT